MQNAYQKLLWVGLAIAIALGLLWQFYPLPTATARLYSLPLINENISGLVVPLSPAERKIFKKINLIKRVYTVENQKCFLYILDGTKDRHAIHDPTYCFRGRGWTIDSQEDYPLPQGTASLVHLKKGNKTRVVMLWFSDQTSHYAAPLRYWWQTTLRRLTLGFSGEEPVLIVIQPLDGKSIDWQKLLQSFPEILQV